MPTNHEQTIPTRALTDGNGRQRMVGAALSEKRAIEISVGGETRYRRSRRCRALSRRLGVCDSVGFAHGIHRASRAAARRAGRSICPHARPVRCRRRGPALRSSGRTHCRRARCLGRRGARRHRRVSPRGRVTRVLRSRRAASAAADGHWPHSAGKSSRSSSRRLRAFLPAWHSIPADRRGRRLWSSPWNVVRRGPRCVHHRERTCCRPRVRAFVPSMLDELLTAGELVWIGAGAVGARDGRITVVFVDQLAAAVTRLGTTRSTRRRAARRARRAACGAGRQLLESAAQRGSRLNRTRDSRRTVGSGLGGRGHQRLARSAACRARRSEGSDVAVRQVTAHVASRPVGLNRIGPPAGQGSGAWLLRCSNRLAHPTEASHAQALQMVERYGVVTREAVLAEGIAGGFTSVYGV